MIHVQYSGKAQKALQKLDTETAERILLKVKYFSSSRENIFRYGKKLKIFKEATHRFRVGDYRVLFRIDQKTKQVVILVIVNVVHRKEAYL
ncbi:type II toxin-antitoxin system RelE/ParE family toxin [Candidatus Peregrinibacteria bacterium]|nr:type II toxin-antitoxin system RelE/ParE family toxin [Candidatus Peregrinibacteria bacterium]